MSAQLTVDAVAGGLMARSASSRREAGTASGFAVLTHHALDRPLFGLAATAGARLPQRS